MNRSSRILPTGRAGPVRSSSIIFAAELKVQPRTRACAQQVRRVSPVHRAWLANRPVLLGPARRLLVRIRPLQRPSPAGFSHARTILSFHGSRLTAHGSRSKHIREAPLRVAEKSPPATKAAPRKPPAPKSPPPRAAPRQECIRGNRARHKSTGSTAARPTQLRKLRFKQKDRRQPKPSRENDREHLRRVPQIHVEGRRDPRQPETQQPTNTK